MASFEEILEKACKDVEIPGAVLVGGSADGISSDPASPSFHESMLTKSARQIPLLDSVRRPLPQEPLSPKSRRCDVASVMLETRHDRRGDAVCGEGNIETR